MEYYGSNIWKMYLYSFFRDFHLFSGVLVPFFTLWGKISFTQIMLLQSMFVFSVFIMELPTGAVADYFGRKTSLIFAAIVTGTGAVIYGLYPSIYIFMIGEFLWGTGYALMSGADQALVYDSLKKLKRENESKKILGRTRSFNLTALMISAPLGSIIATSVSLRATMMLMAIPMACAAIVGLTLKEPKTTKKVESTRYLTTLVSGIKYFRSHKILKILAFDAISINILAFFLIWLYQTFLIRSEFPLIYFGLIHSAITVGEIIFLNNFGFLEKLFGSKKRYMLMSALIAGTAYILLGFVSSIILTIALFMIISSFGLTRYSLMQNYMNKHIESGNRATVLSTVSMVNRFIMGLCYPLVGLLTEWSLDYTVIILGFLMIIFAFISRVEEGHLLD